MLPLVKRTIPPRKSVRPVGTKPAPLTVTVGSHAAVAVGVAVGVGVFVEVEVLVGVAVFVDVAVLVGVGVLVDVGVLVGVGVLVVVGVLVDVAVLVGVAVGSMTQTSSCAPRTSRMAKETAPATDTVTVVDPPGCTAPDDQFSAELVTSRGNAPALLNRMSSPT